MGTSAKGRPFEVILATALLAGALVALAPIAWSTMDFIVAAIRWMLVVPDYYRDILAGCYREKGLGEYVCRPLPLDLHVDWQEGLMTAAIVYFGLVGVVLTRRALRSNDGGSS